MAKGLWDILSQPVDAVFLYTAVTNGYWLSMTNDMDFKLNGTMEFVKVVDL